MVVVKEHARLMRNATVAALSVAITLAVVKALAWWWSGSVSLLAGLTDSLLDGAASLLNLLAVRYALQPPDEQHRYGHGKAEALAGLGQALFIGCSALLVGAHGLERLLHPQPMTGELAGVLVMLFSLGLTGILLGYQRYVVRETGSTAIRADSLHYRSDLLLNTSILLALVLAGLGWDRADAVFGLGIALYILWSAVTIAREASAILMDTELPKDISEQIYQLASGVPGLLECHDLRTRVSGTNWFIQLHASLPDTMSLYEAHEVCVAIQKAIQEKYPQADVLVHADPFVVYS